MATNVASMMGRLDEMMVPLPLRVSLPLPPTAVGVAPRTQEKEYQNVASGRLKVEMRKAGVKEDGTYPDGTPRRQTLVPITEKEASRDADERPSRPHEGLITQARRRWGLSSIERRHTLEVFYLTTSLTWPRQQFCDLLSRPTLPCCHKRWH